MGTGPASSAEDSGRAGRAAGLSGRRERSCWVAVTRELSGMKNESFVALCIMKKTWISSRTEKAHTSSLGRQLAAPSGMAVGEPDQASKHGDHSDYGRSYID